MDARRARALLDRFGRFIDRFTDCFSRRVQRTAASQYIEGLFNNSERTSMQAMHGRLSDPIHYQALQHFITHSPWPAKPLWDRLSEVIPERRGILALDDTGLPKQGRHSVGVKRQYSGTLGKTGNCQVAVSSLLIGKTLVWPLGCELYVPHDWFDDARRAEAGIPSRLRFREKWQHPATCVQSLSLVFAAVQTNSTQSTKAQWHGGRAFSALALCLAHRRHIGYSFGTRSPAFFLGEFFAKSHR